LGDESNYPGAREMYRRSKIKLRGRIVEVREKQVRPPMVYFPPKFTGSKQWNEN